MIKPLINYILWHLGIRKILPKEFVNRVIIKEKGESFVPVRETERLKIIGDYPGVAMLRKEVYARLETAAENLQGEHVIILAEGFRSMKRQRKLWNEQYAKIKTENPGLPLSELERMTAIFIAKPKGDYGGHQTGGAVDVTLGDKDGKELFFGTKIGEPSLKSATDSKDISQESKDLRIKLLKAMNSAGFINYPAEWWHFSYGDRLWAAYSGLKKCYYGPINDPQI